VGGWIGEWMGGWMGVSQFLRDLFQHFCLLVFCFSALCRFCHVSIYVEIFQIAK